MKRQKQVFRSAEVAHIWASQSQESGRNSASSIFFNDETIFSYGLHFPMARLYVENDRKIALHTTRTYSVTTRKHQGWAWRATSHMLSFEVPNIHCPKSEDNVQHLANRVADVVNATVFGRTGMDTAKECLLERATEFNQYCEAFGIQDRIEFPKDFLEEFEALAKVKLVAERAANAKRDARREAQCAAGRKMWAEREKQRAEALKRLPQDMIDWSKGLIDLPVLAYKAPIKLRINPADKVIETSHGAMVEFDDAIAFIQALEAGRVKKGDRVGPYEFEKMTKKELVIGCHNIPIKEFKKVSDWLLNRPSNVVPLNARGDL